MIARGEGCWRVEGAVKVDSAATLLAEGEAIWEGADIKIDLSGVLEADSAVIALLLSWRRRALREGRKIGFLNASDSVRSLANLYDVEEVLFSFKQDD